MQCYKWSQPLHNHAKSLFTEHGVGEPDWRYLVNFLTPSYGKTWINFLAKPRNLRDLLMDQIILSSQVYIALLDCLLAEITCHLLSWILPLQNVYISFQAEVQRLLPLSPDSGRALLVFVNVVDTLLSTHNGLKLFCDGRIGGEEEEGALRHLAFFMWRTGASSSPPVPLIIELDCVIHLHLLLCPTPLLARQSFLLWFSLGHSHAGIPQGCWGFSSTPLQ